MNEKPAETIDEYLESFPPEVRGVLRKVRETIRRAAPDATEAIKYRMPTFVLGGNLVHFAGCKNHVGFYPTPSAIRAFAKDLEVYENAKGSVQFPLDRAMPYPLIRKMVLFRVKEVREKLASVKRPATKARRRA
jgi:uncharacterized protein YdhG (YjbR/CyaY superfamily)